MLAERPVMQRKARKLSSNVPFATMSTRRNKMGPSLKGLLKRKTLQSGKPVSEENVMAQINNGGNGMPAYADMLSADDKANIMAYLHTL